MDVRQFIAELRTRGVYRVAALYCAGAWALLQVADLFFPMLGLPEGSVTAVLLAAAAGFPFALLLAWLFDLTPRGVVAAPPVPKRPRRIKLSPRQVVEPALILVLTLLVGFLYLERLTGAGHPGDAADTSHLRQERPSIAVMPFVSMSDARGTGYLGDGLAEEILNLLAQLNELNVAARTSSFQFRGSKVDLQEIANRLGVDHILEGSVRSEGNKLRISVQLVDTDSGYQVWSASYDRDMGGLLELQESIARSVVDSLQVVLSEQSSEMLSRQFEVAPLAYDYYLRGRHYLRQQVDESNLNAAVSFFRRALEINDRFADAWAGLCDGMLGLYEITHSGSVFNEGEQSCQRALALDDQAVPVYVALGNLYRVSGEPERALKAFNHALELNPGAVEAYRGRGKTYASMNQPALVERDLLKAIELQPSFWSAQNELGAWYFESGDFERAIPYFERVANLNPESDSALNNLGAAYYMAGKVEMASEAWSRSVALAPSAISLSNLGSSLFYAGRFREAASRYEQAVQLAPENFEYWGNLGEALSFVPEEAARSSEAFGRAIGLGSDYLAINPRDGRAQAMVASYLARTGRQNQAIGLLNRELGATEPTIQESYFRAVTFLALDDRKAALAALERAVELGYPGRLLSMDSNFRTIRQAPDFMALTSDSSGNRDAEEREAKATQGGFDSEEQQ